MRRSRPLAGLCILACWIAGNPSIARAGSVCEGAAFSREISARLVPRLEHYTLDNGLRVVLAPREAETSASVRVAYDVGARDEASGRGGLAHYFEHMMFKGSAQVPDGGHFRIVRDAGGRPAYEDEFGTDEAAVVQRYPVLGRGRYTVEVTGSSGRRFAGEFVVESLTPTRKALRFELSEVR